MPLTANQQAAVDCTGRPLFIQAGAGTGKTFTLTKKLGQALSPVSGPLLPSVANVLTITFTNKAAGELLGRVRAELRSLGLDKAALEIDSAWISTIHSMCQRILSAYALAAHIDPGIELLTEEQSATLMNRAVELLLINDELAPYVDELTEALGVDKAIDLLTNFATTLACSPTGEFEYGPALQTTPEGALRGLVHGLSACAYSLEKQGARQGSATAIAQMERIDNLIAAASAKLEQGCETWADVEDAIGELPIPKGGNLKIKEGINEAKDYVCETRAIAAVGQAQRYLDVAQALAHILADWHGKLKAHDGVEDTNDLLTGAYQLLRDNPAIAEVCISSASC